MKDVVKRGKNKARTSFKSDSASKSHKNRVEAAKEGPAKRWLRCALATSTEVPKVRHIETTAGVAWKWHRSLVYLQSKRVRTDESESQGRAFTSARQG